MPNSISSENKSNLLAALIPAWNSGEALMLTLDSIAAQPVECQIFVVDDGSEPAVELPDRIGNKRIHLIRLNKNQGITVALNTGLKLILNQGFKFISRHDCGDIDNVERLNKQLDYLQHHEDVMLVGCSVCFNTPNRQLQYIFDAPVEQASIKRRMCYSAALVHSSCMFRANVFSELGLYSKNYPHAEDYDLFFRMLANHNVHNLTEVLVTARYSPDSISMLNRRTSLMSRLKLQLKYFELFNIHSYIGISQTICLNIIPYRLVSLFKSAQLCFGKK